ncbi:MAG: polysaccharide deacetylase family protein [Treponema sp.]|uniref:polysaccharide deacetylase family protein n=1 Tax=Treponema sp. TaxID=166 RepID=UPI0025D276EB|nr:polysaccharide deacetylase family protein [Treponema sp.]MBQ8679269.1 polysaccharide deacetylase family protein [Treponema sp.]
MMSRKIVILILIFLNITFLHAQVKFENPQINAESKVLFTVNHKLGGTVSYKTLFMADATQSESTRILTCFPEKMELLSNGSVLQVRNRYGTARYSVADSTLSWIKREDSIPADAKAMLPQAVSPDGKWACFVKKTDAASGELYLKNMSTLEEFLLNDKCDFDYDEVPAKWAGDGSVFVYEKAGNLYFGDPKAIYQKVQMGEEFRKIGEGTINCVQWANGKYLIYINRDLVYKISAKELYTRGLYSPVVGIGIVIGRLPIGFDSHKDKFWVSPQVNQIVTVSANSVISSYKINGTASSYFTSVYSKPFKDISASAVDYDVFFCSDGSQILWVNLIGLLDGKRNSSVYRLSSELKELIRVENATRPLLSPDGRKIVFASQKFAFVYDLGTWLELGRISGEKVYSYAWSGSNLLYIGGESTVREWKAENNRFSKDGKMLFLSSANTAFWKPNAENIVCAQSATNKATFYDYDPFKNVWQTSADDSRTSFEFMKKAEVSVYAVQNARYRVYTGLTDNKLYENALYIRNFSGNGTSYAVYPETVKPSDERKKLALIFDAIDSADGLTHILAVLANYDIKATFFLNGEFIRRYPQECKQIIESGHDCASMYFSVTDLTEKGFIIDENFIRRGLARNEDEFYAATGRELSLLWHAPFYKANNEIKKAGELSGYKYIEAGRLSLDSYTLEKAADGKKWYLSARDLVKLYVDSAEPDMIIPVTVGLSDGTRRDFLYEKLSLLIGDFLDFGYEFKLVRDLK